MLRTALKLTCLLLATSLYGTAPAAPLPDFNASYELRLGSLRIGNSTISLENGPDGSYRYESRSTPTQLASWLFKDNLTNTTTTAAAARNVRRN
jgi:hypothetical protein